MPIRFWIFIPGHKPRHNLYTLKYFPFILILSYSLNSFSQTCIIVNKTNDAIYIGADSRGKAFESVPGTTPVTLCKINTVGKFNFAISGVGFPMALEECKNACKGKTSFFDAINSFAPPFIKKLQDTLEIVRQRLPSLFIELTSESKFLSTVIFFGVESDSLYLAQVKFKLESDINHPVYVSGSGGPYENKPTIIATGLTDEIEDTIFKKGTWKNGIVKTINSLIKIEIKYHPKEVNGDIDILKVTKNGNTWIQRKKICN